MARQVTAVATRSGDWWAVEVPEISGLFTQARRLDQVSEMVVDAARLLTGEDVEVSIRPVLPTELEQAVEDVKAQAAEAERAQRVASESVRSLVAHLRHEGMTVRDVGTVLGISKQRVSQLHAV